MCLRVMYATISGKPPETPHSRWTHHGVINDPTVGVGDKRQTPIARLETLDVPNNALLDEVGGIFTCPPDLPHVAHVEDAGVAGGAAVQRLVHDSSALVLVQHGKLVAREGHHLALHVDVHLMVCCFLQRA